MVIFGILATSPAQSQALCYFSVVYDEATRSNQSQSKLDDLRIVETKGIYLSAGRNRAEETRYLESKRNVKGTSKRWTILL